MENIFDTHAHYDDSQFDEDRDKLLSSFPSLGICAVINCGTDLRTSVFSAELANKYDFIYAAAGLHPEELNNISENDFDEIKALAKNENKLKAIGEIGLDYYWKEVPKEKQTEYFEKQILLAKELDLPVIVHDREAHEDTLKILQKYKPKGVVHCFSGSAETAKEILKIGMYIGIGGVITFKNARKAVEVAQMLPLDRLLLETDCPYMAPVPFRGKRNDSSLIPYSALKLARIKNTEPQSLADITAANAKKLFNI
jgi:TatD DNase family protein